VDRPCGNYTRVGKRNVFLLKYIKNFDIIGDTQIQTFSENSGQNLLRLRRPDMRFASVRATREPLFAPRSNALRWIVYKDALRPHASYPLPDSSYPQGMSPHRRGAGFLLYL
jgi:hypothetical protein